MQSIIKRILIPTAMLISSLMLSQCKHEIPGNNGTGNTAPVVSASCSADSVYFQNTIQPLINTGCAISGCHDATTRSNGVELTSYTNIINTGDVRPGNPGNSKLYKVLNQSGNDRMPQPPNPAFTSAQKSLVYQWILQGARNNYCNSCDTSIFSFSGSVGPIINTYCKGCHNPALLSGGVDLSTYASVKFQATAGNMLGVINHAPGFLQMPQGGNKLTDCQITQITKWVAAGSPNN